MFKQFWLTIFISILSINVGLSNVKHALIVAIGNYPAEKGWPKLSSVNDAGFIKSALREHKFEECNIHLVLDSQATVAEISSAFEQMIRNVRQGDVVVIHFSCHGEQVMALDPNKHGGLDQCVVTYDAILPRLSKDFEKDQAAYYRGQTIGSYLLQIRARLGKEGDVAVFMDYCHSGAGTRGIAKKRGGEPPFMPDSYNKTHKINQTGSDLVLNGSMGRVNSHDLATFVAISATRPEELNQETIDDNGVEIGSLTYALCKSLKHLEPTTTYRSMFAMIQAFMCDRVPAQHPLIEGVGLDRTFFGGDFVVQKPYVEIDNIEGGNTLVLKSGLLAGLDTGAKVMLCKSGTIDPKVGSALAYGKVILSENFTATVQLDRQCEIVKPADGWVFVTEVAYRIKPISVQIELDKHFEAKYNSSGFSEHDANGIKEALRDERLISFLGKPELLLVKGHEMDSILIAADGSFVGAINNSSLNTKHVSELINNYAKCRFLKEIMWHDEDLNVAISLVPVINGTAKLENIKSKVIGGVYEFHVGDTLRVYIKNNSSSDVFVNILDLQPDGVINAILPNKANGMQPNELQIKAGDEFFPQNYNIVIGPPVGTEVFKIFVSKEEIDMEGIASERGYAQTRGGGTTRGNLSAMEKLMRQFNIIGLRGDGQINSETAEGAAFNVVFKIVH